ncbi:MAG: FGGY-family carbohydrate kinase [Conexivisphaerales archaeon]
MYACIDVGTSSCKLAIYDESMKRTYEENVQLSLAEDGMQDASSILQCVKGFLARARDKGAKSAGIACYRSSLVSWDRDGRPLSKVITWLSHSTEERYKQLSLQAKVLSRFSPFNLVISPNSPALRYLVARDSARSSGKEFMVWTLDSFLAYNLVRKFVSDATNAALTGLIDPATFKPIKPVISLLGIDEDFPSIIDNTEPLGSYEGVEINSIIADQQAACIAEAATVPGVCKVTNGTGTFVDIPIEKYRRVDGLIPIVILRHKNKAIYGAEGYLPTSGSAIQLLFRLGILHNYSELETISSSKLFFIPSLAGLQLPSIPRAKGLIAGLDLNTDRAAMVQALLKSIAFHVRMVIEDSGERVGVIRADGKLSLSNRLLSLISSATNLAVERQRDVEATQKGLALLQMLSNDKIAIGDIESQRKEVDVIKGEVEPGIEEEYLQWKEKLRLLRS